MIEDSKLVERRELLKATGAGVGLVGIGVLPGVSVAAETENSIGEATFVEVSVGHEDVPSYPVTHSDDFAEYLVDGTRGRVVLTKFADDETRTLFRNNDLVATDMTGSYRTPPRVQFGGTRSQYARLGPTRELQLDSVYRSPSISLRNAPDGSVEASSGPGTVRVDPRAHEQLRLPQQEVTGRPSDAGTETVLDHRTESREIEVTTRGERGTSAVTPVVTVTNHGAVEVYVDQ